MTTARPKVGFDPTELLKTLPRAPGVYIMKDREGSIVYVGKGKDLRSRVSQYFTRRGDDRWFVPALPALLGDIEVILTATEKEALLLEATLIRHHQPRFNVLLKDDKRYITLRLAVREQFPRLEVVRKVRKDRARYFGPYPSALSVRQTLDLVNRHFRLRTCSDREMRNRSRPCLNHYMHRCEAPCSALIEPAEYGRLVRAVVLFLEGRRKELTGDLEQRMWAASEVQDYERAARLRDQIRAVTCTVEQQHAVSHHRKDRDAIGLFREGPEAELQLLNIRRGRLSAANSYSLDNQEVEEQEILEGFLGAYYLRQAVDLPSEILLPVEVAGAETLEELLEERAGRKIKLVVPKAGEKKELVELAHRNAVHGFFEKRKSAERSRQLLERLARKLNLHRPPERIECFDGSSLGGACPVASMVVFEAGHPNRSAYRRYRIRTAKGGDDYGTMKEVLSRRLRRAKEEGTLPDLLVVDGGKGQLSAALAAMEDLGVGGLDVIALAKSRLRSTDDEDLPDRSPERVFVPGRKNPVILPQNSGEQFLLSRVRDEAHRFAIEYHRELRRKRNLRSVLDDIPGVGPKRKAALLKTLGSLKRIRGASEDELAAVPGVGRQAAQAIQEYLRAVDAF